MPVTDPCVDLGRTAIGQANLAVTPLQMAMVVSAIANDGKLMQPRLTSQVVNQDGQVVADDLAPGRRPGDEAEGRDRTASR